MRIGQGFDVHAFGEGDKIMIGGVVIPYERGLIAHSDGDVLLHALCDALLGAAALGDIGKHFPDSDAEYKNIDSRSLLRLVYAKLKAKGLYLVNADMTVIAQEPKMAPYIPMMRDAIAGDLESALELINIKATTTEMLGFTGRREGIAALATVLLSSRLTEEAKPPQSGEKSESTFA